VQLVAELAEAMVTVWRELGLPLGTMVAHAPHRAETIAAGG
jgi:hypothetical protein